MSSDPTPKITEGRIHKDFRSWFVQTEHANLAVFAHRPNIGLDEGGIGIDIDNSDHRLPFTSTTSITLKPDAAELLMKMLQHALKHNEEQRQTIEADRKLDRARLGGDW